MIIAGDTTNYQFMSKFPLQTFLPLPSLLQGFANDHQVSQQKYVEDGLSDHVIIHRYPVAAPPPINRLPIELLADIFFLTLRNYAGDWGMQGPPLSRKFPGLSFSPGSSSDPMTLAQVCRHWRGVALTTPTLWSSMAILCINRTHHMPLLMTWLQRSGDCPLDISLIEPFRASQEKDERRTQQTALVTEILSLLITHSHRWKAINFRFSLRIPPVLTTLPAGSLKVLQSATILSTQTPTPLCNDLSSLDKVWEAIHTSPSFREGNWEFGYLQHRLHSIPWMKLTRVDVTMSIDALFEALLSCHNLVDLRFTEARLVSQSFTIQSTPRFHPGTTFILPYLRKFSMTVNQPSDVIFHRLSLPSLVSFSVRQYRTCESYFDPTSFNDLLARSHCRLQKYDYEDPSPDGEDYLLEILASPLMSDLVDLTVESSVTNKLATLLTHAPGPHAALPKLEKLFIGACTTSPGVLVNMVVSRRLKVGDRSLLRDMQICNWGYHEADLEGFKVLAEQGMYIDV